jgi:hypothetical protein
MEQRPISSRLSETLAAVKGGINLYDYSLQLRQREQEIAASAPPEAATEISPNPSSEDDEGDAEHFMQRRRKQRKLETLANVFGLLAPSVLLQTHDVNTFERVTKPQDVGDSTTPIPEPSLTGQDQLQLKETGEDVAESQENKKEQQDLGLDPSPRVRQLRQLRDEIDQEAQRIRESFLRPTQNLRNTYLYGLQTVQGLSDLRNAPDAILPGNLVPSEQSTTKP